MWDSEKKEIIWKQNFFGPWGGRRMVVGTKMSCNAVMQGLREQGLREHNSLHKGNPSNIQEAKGVLLLGWFAGGRQTQKGVSGAQRQGPKAVSTLSQNCLRDLPLLLQRQRLCV